MGGGPCLGVPLRPAPREGGGIPTTGKSPRGPPRGGRGRGAGTGLLPKGGSMWYETQNPMTYHAPPPFGPAGVFVGIACARTGHRRSYKFQVSRAVQVQRALPVFGPGVRAPRAGPLGARGGASWWCFRLPGAPPASPRLAKNSKNGFKELRRPCDEVPFVKESWSWRRVAGKAVRMDHEVRWPRGTQLGVADWVSFGRLQLQRLRPKPPPSR
jgi:hypothetical protein